MAHRTTAYRRNLAAASDPGTSSMDPTSPLHLHPLSPTTTTKPHHPDPPSSSSSSSSSVHSISNHFSRNHKSLASLKPSTHARPQPSLDTHLHAGAAKPTASSAISTHVSTTSLTKSYSQRRPNTRVKEKVNKELCDEGQEIKREIITSKFDDVIKKERASEGGRQVITKPNYFLMGTNQELQEGYFNELKGQSFSSSLGGSGGRRRSFCSSQAELANFLSCNGVKVVAVDMAPFMQIHAVDCARKTHDSLEKFAAKTLALTLKKEFDGVYGPAWHCVVGTSFGSFVTHSVGGFLYFSMDQKQYVLLFKTTVQKAS